MHNFIFMENTESYGEWISKEVQKRFKLTNEATDQISRDIDKAVGDGIKLDAYMRLPPKARKKEKTYVDPKCYNKRKASEPLYTNCKRAYNKKVVDEVVELANLRKEIHNIMKDHYEGRVLSNETKIKMNRIKELEAKFANQ